MPLFMWIVAVDFYLMSFLTGDDYYYWLGGMFVEGFFIGGPYMIISAAIASDLVIILKSKKFIANRENQKVIKIIRKQSAPLQG